MFPEEEVNTVMPLSHIRDRNLKAYNAIRGKSVDMKTIFDGLILKQGANSLYKIIFNTQV